MIRRFFKLSQIQMILRNDCLMRSNADKCKIMHFGYNNTMTNYELNDKNLEVTKEECDLGVIMQNDLKCRLQCIKAVNTANIQDEVSHLSGLYINVE